MGAGEQVVTQFRRLNRRPIGVRNLHEAILASEVARCVFADAFRAGVTVGTTKKSAATIWPV
jgi:hypothetical protein